MCLRTSAKGWRRAGGVFATYALTWRRFCDDFCRAKKYHIFKTLVNCLRQVCMRGLCDTMRTFRDSLRWFGELIRKPIANLSHPSEIGTLLWSTKRVKSNDTVRTLFFYRSYAIFTVRTLYFTVRTVKFSVRTVKFSVRTVKLAFKRYIVMNLFQYRCDGSARLSYPIKSRLASQ